MPYGIGEMYSTSNDLASLMSLFFRDNLPADDGHQILDGQTLREMMNPAFMFPDQSTGFAIPFELEYYKSYQIQTKEGDITGYSAKIDFIPQMKLGIVVNCNMMGHAKYIMSPIVGIIMEGFDQWLRNNQPTDLLPPNYKALIGIYQDDSKDLTKIYVGQNGPFTQLFISSNILGFVDLPLREYPYPSVSNTLQVVPIYNGNIGCNDIATQGYFTLITIVEDGTLVLTCPGAAWHNLPQN